MKEKILNYFRCLHCASIHEKEFTEEAMSPFPRTLECEYCGEIETIGLWNDEFGYFDSESFTLFKEFSIQEESSSKIEYKGRQGEVEFLTWLNKYELPFLFVEQSQGTFPSVFTNKVKRPDVLLLLDTSDIVAVDVKNYTQYKKYLTLNIVRETKRHVEFENLFKFPVWYAFMAKKGDSNSWLWISEKKASKKGRKLINSSSKEEFLSIDIKHFKRITSHNELLLLLTKDKNKAI